METCNLCREVIKPGEQAVWKQDYHHKECWDGFIAVLEAESVNLEPKIA